MRLCLDLARDGIERPIQVFDNGSADDQRQLVVDVAAEVRRRALRAGTSIDFDPWSVVSRPDARLYAMWNEALDTAARDAAALGALAWNVAVLNNDLIVGTDWLATMASGLRVDGRLWAVCGNWAGFVSPKPGRVLQVRGSAGHTAEGGPGLAGFAFMVAGEKLAGAGVRFDEDYRWWYGDDDFALAVEAAGGHLGLVLDAPLIHLFERSDRRADPEFAATVREDYLRFVSRWPGWATAHPEATAAARTLHGLDAAGPRSPRPT